MLLPPALSESFEICLARIADLEQSGQNVKAIACDGDVKGCIVNPIGLAAICQHCQRVRTQALAQVTHVTDVISLSHVDTQHNYMPTQEQLQQIDESALNTILTFYRQDPDSHPHNSLRRKIYSTLATRLRNHTVFVYRSLLRIFETERIDRLEFFNGRITPTRGALLAAQRAGNAFAVLEVSGRNRYLTVTENASVHDLHAKQTELLQFLESKDYALEDGDEFFRARRIGAETNDRSFTQGQRPGVVTLDERPVVSIFTSSSDELKISGPQWFTQASNNPIQFILDLAMLISDNYNLIVRMHPNQLGDKTGQAATMIRALSNVPHLTLIRPDSRASTYEILDKSVCVITFGSTIGLEATYWGKPSLLAGRALWDQLEIAYKVDTPQAAALLVRSPPACLSRDQARAVGSYYMRGTGQPGTLGWKAPNTNGFSVRQRDFLTLKRSSLSYWVSRAINKLLLHS